MKLVAVTLALGLSLGVALFAIACVRVGYLRGNLVADMRRDQLVIGNVLRIGVANVWRDVPDPERATRETRELIDRADGMVGSSYLRGRPRRPRTVGTPRTPRRSRAASLSRGSVRAGAARVGTLVIRESLGDIEAVIRTDVATSGIAIALIVVFGAVASAVLSAWLVGRPVARLVEHARRIGRRELSADAVVRTRDELGALAAEQRGERRAGGGAGAPRRGGPGAARGGGAAAPLRAAVDGGQARGGDRAPSWARRSAS